MSMRIFSLSLLLFLAACGGRADEASETGTVTANSSRIMCMVDGETKFSELCTLQLSTGDDGQILTLSSPSGGFRRLRVTGDGHGVAAADGAVPAKVRPVGAKLIEVTIGDDRYRIPANVSQTKRESL
jgi:hypothetical protein